MTATKTRRGETNKSAPKRRPSRSASTSAPRRAPATKRATTRAKGDTAVRAKKTRVLVPQAVPVSSKHEAVALGEGVFRLELDTDFAVGVVPYVIVDGDEAVLVDPGGLLTADVMIAALSEVVEPKKVRFLIVHHQDPDVCSALNALVGLVADDCKVVCHSRIRVLLEHMGAGFEFVDIDKAGWRLTFGHRRELTFAHTPYLHSPGAIVTYDARSKTAFTSDLFANMRRGLDRVASEGDIAGIAAFHVDYMAATDVLQHGLAEIWKLGPIERIAPQHGAMVEGELVEVAFERVRSLAVGSYADSAFEEQRQRALENVRMRALVENSSVRLMVADPKGIIQYVNPAAVALFTEMESHLSCKATELVGRSFDEFHRHAHHQQGMLARHHKVLPHQSVIDFAGRKLEIRAFGIYDDDGEFQGMGVAWDDITARLAAEEDSHRKVAHLNALPNPVMSIDRDFNVTFMSHAGLKMLDKTEEEVVGKKCYDLVATDHCRTEKCCSMQAMRDGALREARNVAHLPSGRLPILYTATPEYDLEGNLVGARELMVDKSKEEVLERAVRDNSSAVTAVVDDVNGLAGDLSTRAATISDQASNVAAAAEELSTTMHVIAEAAQGSQGDVTSIASATTQLNASVAEIAEHAEKARAVAETAVRSVSNASDRVDELEQAAREISLVTDTIMEIAEQTKLLALNATIEAARAGEAGKGFAVVASEVKDLAKQTNGATKDIRRKISAITQSSESTISEIGSMTEVIQEVNGFVSVVATATEEQSAASKSISDRLSSVSERISDMANNVTQAAEVTQEVTSNVATVSQNIGQVGLTTGNLHERVASLAHEAQKLEHEAEKLGR